MDARCTKRAVLDALWVILGAFLAVQGCRPGAKKEGETLPAPEDSGSGDQEPGGFARIIEQCPRRLSELEKITGKLGRDPEKDFMHLARHVGSGGMGAVEVDYAIDIHHQDPREVEDPALGRYSIAFDSGLTLCLDLLEKKYGEPRMGEKDGAQVYRFDTAPSSHPKVAAGFYLYPAEGDAFRLEWRDSVPDFAFPARAAEDAKDLEGKIIALLGQEMSRDRFQSVLGALEKDGDWDRDVIRTGTWTFASEPAGAARPERFTFSFGPPIDAAGIIEALGVKKPVVVSTDVHMTSRIVADYGTRAFPEAGGYRIELHVEEKGLVSTKLDWPASVVWKAESYRIESIEGMSLKLLE